MKRFCVLLLAALVAMPSFAQKTTVTRVTRETTVTRVTRETDYHASSSREVDIWYQGEVNVGYGTSGSVALSDLGLSVDANFGRVFLETVHGARITKYAYAGLGVGVQYAYDAEEVLLPVFVDLRGYCPVGDFAPYVAVDLGYAAGFDQIDGGFYGSFGAGLNYKRLNFGLGYQMLCFSESFEGYKFSERAGSFFVKVGVKF